MTILVTGVAGFIGANFAVDWLAGSAETVVNLVKWLPQESSARRL